MQTTVRRTSQYSLAVPAPEHADADRHAALDALRDAAVGQGLLLTGVWHDAGTGDLCIAWRSATEDTARAEAGLVLRDYASVDPSAARMWTGYGTHRRDFAL